MYTQKLTSNILLETEITSEVKNASSTKWFAGHTVYALGNINNTSADACNILVKCTSFMTGKANTVSLKISRNF